MWLVVSMTAPRSQPSTGIAVRETPGIDGFIVLGLRHRPHVLGDSDEGFSRGMGDGINSDISIARWNQAVLFRIL